ncbi:MAG TPA: S-methyl-5-thioribose-1-phosphate isomerase, partial [Rhizobiales bacterium]|nr:S-methyl-5-thioribose-1-phosphate isomerase [Hyphomicrobiales bacterium]
DWPVEEFRSEVEKQAAFLKTARPTAVNLAWALDRMCKTVRHSTAKSGRELLDLMIGEAQTIHNEDIELCNAMGKNGAHLIRPGMGVLTHCNAGSLATSGIGTATAPMYVAHASGTDFTVYADETRPLLQGARLTAWELQKAGIDVRLICDNMAGHLMARGDIDMVITGTDRVAANGDVANKIGTMSAAILAHHFGIPFYVACPSSTIDFNCPDGTNIPIEERAGHEVTSFANCQAAAPGTRTANPAFDVTPAEFVTGLITEKGIITAPYRAGLKALHG